MATAEQRSRAQVYRDAAAEHTTAARELYELGFYAQANYLAGLSVECILRAYRHMVDAEFDSRHDIDRLFKLAKFADVVPAGRGEELGALLGDIVMLWANDHRFLSTSALRRRWTTRRLYEGIRGDFVKERTRQLLNAATELVNIGVVRWNSSFRN